MKNFWTGFAIAALVAIVAVFLARKSEFTGGQQPEVRLLLHVYPGGPTCRAVVGPKAVPAKRSTSVAWFLRNDCGQSITYTIDNFRPKPDPQTRCEDQHPSRDSQAESPIEEITTGADDSRHTRVKSGASPGAYCYDVTVKVGTEEFKADPEMDIVP